MNYQETLAYLYAQLPMYQRVGAAAYKKDLGNTINLCKSLKNPHQAFKSVHIAGTNGKGSTSHMIASVLQESGYKTGLYTSPHLVDFRERIKVNGVMISEDAVISFVERIRPELESIRPSFFEITVAMAFDYFKREGIDIAVIETGLGGRLDSTNIIDPILSVITNIGLDHSDMLGDTLQLIAGEKAGIIKPRVPVVIGEYQEETLPVFISKANQTQSNLVKAWKEDQEEETSYESDLKGVYQKHNTRTAICALYQLKNQGLEISNANISSGLLNVVANTGLLGRWQILQEEPKVICDTGHNTEGLNYVIRQLMTEKAGKLHLVFGQVSGKELDKILQLLPKDAEYYFCTPSIPRGLPFQTLSEEAAKFKLQGKAYSSVSDAFESALLHADKADAIFVGGSTFVVADLLVYWKLRVE